MPLLVAPPPASTPLSQGDLIEGVALHGTNADGGPCQFDAAYGLVISRDCVGANKGQVVVASVVEIRDRQVSDSEIQSVRRSDNQHEDLPRLYRSLVKALEATRDGGLSPDRIYLGPLPNKDKRLVAKLDELTTIALPGLSSDKVVWVSKRRIARLSPDATRALPTRLFWAFTRVGFDDHEWLPDPDLRAVCAAGSAAVGALQARVGVCQLQLNQAEAAHEVEGKLKNLRNDVKNAEENLNHLIREVGFFNAELERRAKLMTVE